MTFKEYITENCGECKDTCDSCKDYMTCDCESCKKKQMEEKK